MQQKLVFYSTFILLVAPDRSARLNRLPASTEVWILACCNCQDFYSVRDWDQLRQASGSYSM